MKSTASEPGLEEFEIYLSWNYLGSSVKTIIVLIGMWLSITSLNKTFQRLYLRATEKWAQ